MSNDEAFVCLLAALTLALRGENVDGAIWGLGSGGVGQSLQTTHLEAILGSYHTCLDVNIYYNDDEMRKQAANMVGKLVVTGQEGVQNAEKACARTCTRNASSADKVPARLPYAIQTTLVELRGLKRFELNSLPRLLVEYAWHPFVFSYP